LIRSCNRRIMGFVKTQSVEKVEVVSPQGHDKIAAELSKLGKTSAADLTEAERRQADLDNA